VLGSIPNRVHVCSYTKNATGLSAYLHKEMDSESIEVMDAGQGENEVFKMKVYDKFMTWIRYTTYTGRDWMWFQAGDILEISHADGRWKFH